MKLRQLTIKLIICLLSFTSNAQLKPILFGGFEYYRDVGFQDNSYGNLHIGTQLFRWHFLAPEVGFNFHAGSVNDREQLNPNDPNAQPPLILKTRFSSHTFSIAPKLIYGNEEAALVFIPQYNFGKIGARGDLMKDIGKQYVLDDQQRVSGSTAFWSFAGGVEGQFFDSEVLYFSLLLKYSRLNSEEILKQIEVGQPELRSTGGSADGYGISFRVYFDLIQLLKKKD